MRLLSAAIPVSLFLGLALAGPAAAQTDDGQDPTPAVTTDDDPPLVRADVETSLEAARALETVEGSDRREKLVEHYAAALAALVERDAALERAERHRTDAAGAPARIESLQAELAGDPPAPEEPTGTQIPELETERTNRATRAERARDLVDELEARQRDAPTRRLEVPQLIATAEEALATLREGLAVADPTEGGAEVATALRTRVEAQIEQQEAVLDELRAEESTFDLRRGLLDEELRLARRDASRADAELALVEDELSKARRAKAEKDEQDAADARDAALMQGDAFRAAADDTLRLRQETLAITDEVDRARRQVAKVRASVDALEKRFADTKLRVGYTGLTAEVGSRLRQDGRRLLEARATSTAFSDIDRRLTDTQVALFDIEVLSERFRESEEWVDALVAAAEEEARNEGREPGDVRPLARRLLSDFRAALAAKAEVLNDGFGYLTELKKEQDALDGALVEYEEFVAERILWIRSTDAIWNVRGRSVRNELRSVASPASWRDAIGSFNSALLRRPGYALGLVLGIVLLAAVRTRVRTAIEEEGALARQRSQVSIAPTLRALVLSLVLAAPFAIALYALAWFARTSGSSDLFVSALGESCEHAAVAALFIGALRALTVHEGLGEAHFEWADDAVTLVRRQSTWLLLVVPLAALAGEFFVNVESATDESDTAAFLPSLDPVQTSALLSRAAFLVEIGAVFVFLWRVLQPTRGVLAINARAALPDDWLTRLRQLWFLLGVGLVGALLVLTLVGYDFTARSLFERFVFTLGFLLVLLVLRAIALRWVRLERRREALEKLRRKREELREKRLAEIERRRNAGEDVEGLESEGLEVHQDEVDFAALSSDVRDLVRMFTGLGALVGVILIWASVLPALGVLDDVKLWSKDVLVQSTSVAEAGAESSAIVPQIEWITLGNLIAAIIALLLTWRAVSDLPSLLEIVLLRRLKLGSGERYAITTLLRYVLTVIGLVIASNELGLSWSKLQWLVAGVSVGLGFGLQEIFANFVSGITLLFERPIRVGDWVTLGDIEGVVSRIRIRATTIRDRDLKELIVPNREFITGRFINWTLSDPISRVVLPVGIAYGSDTESAIQLLLESGRDCPYSVAEPAPNVVFKQFGESSLDFELRVFVAGREIMPRVVHDLHMRVDAAFRRAEIEISFPQRDLHVRTAPMFEPASAAPDERDGSARNAT